MGKETIKFKIEGLKEVEKMLKSLPKTANDKVLYDINRTAAKIVKDQLSADAPDGINNSKSEDKAANNVVIAKSKTNRTGVLIGFAKKVFYVLFIERGTKVRKTKKRGTRGSITRKPFIEESHAKAYPKVIQFFTDNFLKLTNKSLRNQARRIRRKNLKGK